MAEAKKCDRCGMLYELKSKSGAKIEGFSFDGIQALRGKSSMSNKYDLCEFCQRSLAEWWSIAKETSR